MDVDYLLFHEDKEKVDDLAVKLAENGTFLFRGYFRLKRGVSGAGGSDTY